MKYLATMALDLLCLQTFPPAIGHDPDDLADVERSWWQTVIHDLEPEEKAQIIEAARREIDLLGGRPALTSEEQQKLAVLTGLVEGTLS